METTPDSPAPFTPAPSTEELVELESEFARLETELAALEDPGEDAEPPDSTQGATT